MAIKIECGDCGKTYTVKDEMEGKKIRCKDCSAVIVIRSDSGDDWNEEVEEEFLPPVRKSSKKKSRRRSSSDGMPIPARLALICLGVMIALTLTNLGAMALQLSSGRIHPAVLIFMGVIDLVRLLIQLRVFWGVKAGIAATRYTSIVMAVFVILSCGGILFGGFLQNAPEILAQLLYLSILLRVVFIGCMLTPSTGDHMRQ
jgi:DNA-directed RNA polymerase subunit RPC12/RpoP